MQQTLQISDFVEKFFYLNDSPFSLKDYPHMKIIYNIDPHRLVMHTSRQVAKSTTLANIILAKSLLMPYTNPEHKGGFRILSVSPTIEQVRVFSYDRVDTVIGQSSIFKKYFIGGSTIQNVFQKRFMNGSVMYLRYGSATADRIRGISADMNAIDEVQDIPDDNIDVIEMTMARSIYKHSIYAGTPKHVIGPLAKRWNESTKNEWIVKCQHCSKHNFMDEENIQPWGLGCRYCHMRLDARIGQWVRTNSSSAREEDDKGNVLDSFLTEGFRVNVLMFAHAPWVNWQKDVYYPFTTKARGMFFNEYLGLPYDAGVAPITEEEIRQCCTGGPMVENPTRAMLDYVNFMGVDWGPTNSENSKTIMSIMQKRGDLTYVIYMKHFRGKEADYAFLHREIPRQYHKWGCQLIGADHGFGEASNAEVRMGLPDKSRLIAFQHNASQKQHHMWNPHLGDGGAYTLSRNVVMTDLFTKIKNRKVVFPDWKDFEPYARDILNIALDFDEVKNSYKYIKGGTDDSFHSLLYADLVGDLYYLATDLGH